MSPLPVAARPPQHTRRYLSIAIGDLAPGATLAFAADATEQRGRIPLWDEMRRMSPERCIAIEHQAREHIVVSDRGASAVKVSLLDEPRLDELMAPEPLYLDISGLAHHVWAPLLSAARRLKKRLRVVYAEPESYRPHPSPASPTVFDLSTGFDGVAPLPGFARLSGPIDETKMLLVALLGFEGSRPEHLALEIDSIPTVIPIVGVPGFRLEFPAFTVACNRPFLEEYRAHGNIRLARASCPFEAFSTLVELKEDFPGYYMYLAPIGTKPHSLGAVWFALQNPTTTELLYDHPVRKAGRTQGIGVIHVYEIPFHDGP
jgi:hypothetical protein